MKRLLTILFVAIGTLNTYAQLNMQFRSQLPYAGLSLANIWGYVDSFGNEYALVGTSTGVSIVDVTNPVNPIQKFTVTGTTSQWREIKTWGNYAYVTTEGCCLGLQIINLSNLPFSVSSSYWTGSGAIAGQLQRAHSLHIDNGYLYLNGSNLFGGAAIIASLSNPVNPTYMSNTALAFTGNIRYVHDCYVRNDTMYGANIYAGFFTIINVSNKSNPVLINTQNTTNNFTHNCWLSDDGRKIFTTDETSNSFLTSYDISNPGNITYLDKVQSNPGSSSIIHNTYIKNDYAVTSWYKDGVVIVDASRPDNLIITGFYDTYTQGSGSGFNGCWGVYPYLPSGNIIASDINNGLFVMTPTYVRACYLEGIVTNSCTGVGISNVVVQISGGNNDASTITGSYKTGSATAGTYSVTFSKTGFFNTVINNVNLSNGTVTNLNVNLTPLTAPTLLAMAPVNVSCFGQSTGQITTTITGGVAPLQYVWSNGQNTKDITNLSAGTYTVTVTDAAGCSITASTVVAQPAALNPSPASNGPVCKGSNLNFTSANGFAGYLWTGPNGFTSALQNPVIVAADGNATGSYVVEVTDGGGCTISKSITALVSDMAITSVITHVACYSTNTGAIDISVNGGTGSYSYLWNNGSTAEDLTNKYPGLYKVTVTDGAGCTKTAKLSVLNLEPSALSISTTKTNIRCFGASSGTATLIPSGGLPPYSYSWNTLPVKTTISVSGLAAGTYIATITDAANCVKLKTFILTQPTQIISNIVQSNVTVNGGNDGSATVTPTGGTPPYTYQWNTFPAQSTPGISNLVAGYYKCKISDSKGCFVITSCTITQPPVRSTYGPNNSAPVFIYPNPVSEQLFLKNLPTNAVSVFRLFDLQGRIVYEDIRIFRPEESIDVSDLESGMYLLEIKNGNKQDVYKIVKK